MLNAWGAELTAHRLVLPRQYLDDAVRAHLRLSGGEVPCLTGPVDVHHLSHGPLVVQGAAQGVSLLAGRLRHLPLRDAWVPRDPEQPLADGLLLLYLAAPAERPPSAWTGPVGSAQEPTSRWAAWVAQHAGAYRLATPVEEPALAVLWINTLGRAELAWRAPTVPARWQAVPALELPGSQMLKLQLPTRAEPQPSPQALVRPIVGHDRPLAAALEPGTLDRMQHSTLACIGLGPTGSPLAHRWVHMGGKLLAIDPHRVHADDLVDGDVLPIHADLAKPDASERFLRPLRRPGDRLTARALSIANPVAGALLEPADIVASCVDQDAARLWASCWALAMHKTQLIVSAEITAAGAQAELWLLSPGAGCVWCVGGLRDPLTEIGRQHGLAQPEPRPSDHLRQRLESPRSGTVASGHLGLRMLEGLFSGQVRGGLLRRLVEAPDGGLAITDWRVPANRPLQCPFCRRLAGAGSRAVTLARVRALLAQAAPQTRTAER